MSARTLTITESDLHYFDAAAADRPIRFIEKFCRHYEGKWAGHPFTLLDWQKEIVRALFGWRRRDTNLRRFRELYLLTAKGAGKTPLLAAVGLYMLLGDGEPGAHVISMASSFEQANLTFDMGKKYVDGSPALSKHAHPQQYKILAPKASKWTVASGKPTGRSGSRPSCVIASEIHEWPGATAQSFALLTANLFKRSQPLLMLDTNAGSSQGSFAWQQHERALRALAGGAESETLLPVIYEAPLTLDWTSEEAAAAANPSLGHIVTFDQLAPQLAKAREDLSAEAEYKRLYLSQWAQDMGKKWLDVTEWDACTAPIDPAAVKDAARYVGVDLSQGDDLCAVVDVWAAPGRLYVRPQFWLPQATAQRYEAREAVPYSKWAAEGAIKLIPEVTISGEVKRRMAADLIASHKTQKIKAVCYDRYKADEFIAALEGAGIVCVPIAQGYSVTPGCAELSRRLKEKSITIELNPVMRSHAETVEVKEDDRGNFWPVKPNAKNKYAGKRGAKIDGIAAIVTALTEARKNGFPAAKKQFSGIVQVL